jgi:two-component system CheB/CheR fusion protein
VRRYTQQATKIIKLIPSDVGRPITDLVSNLEDPALAADVREVLRTLNSTEKPVSAPDGRWYSVRIMPYRTIDDRIDGVVITFADITAAKTLEAKLRGQQAVLEKNLARRDAPAVKRITTPADKTSMGPAKKGRGRAK